MDGLDPRDGAVGPRQQTPKLPANINSRVSTWLTDYATRVTAVTGRAPLANPAVFVTDRRGMATALGNVSGAMVPSIPGAGSSSDWLMRQLTKQMAKAMAKDTLGLYVPTWQAGGGAAALYVVAQNIEESAAELGVKPEALAHYVTFHEATHQWQFTANTWLDAHMKAATDDLKNVMTNVNPREVFVRLIASGGDLMGALPGVAQIQSTMSLIEGYADFMTEQLGISRDPELATVATALAARRASRLSSSSRTPMQELIGRLTGMDAKRRQYAEGKAFCEVVHRAGGDQLLNRIWTGPSTLPTPAEMASPELWVRRMRQSGGGTGQAAA